MLMRRARFFQKSQQSGHVPATESRQCIRALARTKRHPLQESEQQRGRHQRALEFTAHLLAPAQVQLCKF